MGLQMTNFTTRKKFVVVFGILCGSVGFIYWISDQTSMVTAFEKTNFLRGSFNFLYYNNYSNGIDSQLQSHQYKAYPKEKDFDFNLNDEPAATSSTLAFESITSSSQNVSTTTNKNQTSIVNVALTKAQNKYGNLLSVANWTVSGGEFTFETTHKSVDDVISDLIEGRRSDQYYVWWNRESPPNLRLFRKLVLTPYDNLFNLTMTHRRDSDIYYPYNTSANVLLQLISKGSGNQTQDVENLLAQKSRLAIWIVSNCAITAGARVRKTYVDTLIAAGLSVDRRGRCFPENGAVENKHIIKFYKFYLSFENSFHCKDYITEKVFYNGFLMGAVPVVWGATKSDYEAVMPPHSVIYAEDFKSPQKLVEYLNYLDNNNTAYREYFNWRTMKVKEMPNYGRSTHYCQLCRVLHGINLDNVYNPKYAEMKTSIPPVGYPEHPRLVRSLQEWYYGSENRECLPTY